MDCARDRGAQDAGLASELLVGILNLSGILDGRPEHDLQHGRAGDGCHGFDLQILYDRIGTITDERFAEGDLNLFAELIQAVSAGLERPRWSSPFCEDMGRNSIVGMGIRAEIVRAISILLRIHSLILLEKSHSVGTTVQRKGRAEAPAITVAG